MKVARTFTFGTLSALSMALPMALSMAIGVGAAAEASTVADGPLIGPPLRLLPWTATGLPATGASTRGPEACPPAMSPVEMSTGGNAGGSAAVRYRGANLLAASLLLSNDYAVPRGVRVVGGVTNNGTQTLEDVVCRCYQGHPDSGGVQIGPDLIFDQLPPSTTRFASVSWGGCAGAARLYFLVDPDNAIAEDNENDNEDRMAVSWCPDVPWVWQAKDGYCNYAALTMLFNHVGSEEDLYATLEFSGCAHSMIYADDHFRLVGGIFVCQAPHDYEFAGEIRNLDCTLSQHQTWSGYLATLRARIDDNVPCETSVDPYYLPQPDYDVFRLYGLHSGHAVVVTAYTDSSVVINDPGVGIEVIGPPLPNPENRGGDVVLDLATFRQAVEATLGTPRLLIRYVPRGVMPSLGVILSQALDHNLQRLDGVTSSYDPGWLYYFLPWIPTFGQAAFGVATEDMAPATFAAMFAWAMAQCGGDLECALNLLAQYFYAGIMGVRLGWEGAASFYAGLSMPGAVELNARCAELGLLGGTVEESFLDMLNAIFYAGGDLAVTPPYLAQMRGGLQQIDLLEDDVRALLSSLHLSDVRSNPIGATGIPAPDLTCSPNPFVDGTAIRWHAAGAVSRSLSVHDASGRLVRTLPETPGGAGGIAWDGRDDRGERLSSGVYFVRDAAGGGEALRVMKIR